MHKIVQFKVLTRITSRLSVWATRLSLSLLQLNHQKQILCSFLLAYAGICVSAWPSGARRAGPSKKLPMHGHADSTVAGTMDKRRRTVQSARRAATASV